MEFVAISGQKKRHSSVDYALKFGFIGLILFFSLMPAGAAKLAEEHTCFVGQDRVSGVHFRTGTRLVGNRTVLHCQFSFDGGVTWTAEAEMDYGIQLRYNPFDPMIKTPEVPENWRLPVQGRVFIVQFKTKGIEAWRQRLRDLGCEILAFMPFQAYLVSMGPDLMDELLELPFVRWVGPYHAAYRLGSELLQRLSTAADEVQLTRVRIQLFGSGLEEKRSLARTIQENGGTIISLPEIGSFIEASLPLSAMMTIASSDYLMYMDRWTPPGPDMDIARPISGAVHLENQTGFLGQGVRGEVLDLGTDDTHYDFDTLSWHGTANIDDHGTCTYGIVFGNGDRDGDGLGFGLGLLPEAEMGYAAWNGGYSGGSRVVHTSELVQAPYNCVFQSNSWGSAESLDYTTASAQMDQMIFDLDLSILQSQGNVAMLQWSRPEAWAKNVISVSGIVHYNDLSTFNDKFEPASAGPAEDGRIKPDVVHFYDGILTTDQLGNQGWSSGDYTCDGLSAEGGTSCFSGTSAATPITAGIVALLYQMWAENAFGTNPTGSTVFEKRCHAMTAKAMLINFAEQWSFSGTSHNRTRMHQGWGLPNIGNAYDLRNNVFIVDETSVMTEFQTDSYCLSVLEGTQELKATLVYLDLPGTTSSSQHRINDLDLKVTAPSGQVYWGNYGLDAGNYSTAGGTKDSKNTVENVFVPGPQAGSWTFEIYAAEINQDAHTETIEVDQDYALVVSGVQPDPTPAPFMVVDQVSLSGGCDDDAFLDRNESNATLEVTFRNIGCLTAEGVTAMLSVDSSPPGTVVSVAPATAQTIGTVPVNGTVTKTWSVSMNDPGVGLCSDVVTFRADISDQYVRTWNDLGTVMTDLDSYTTSSFIDNVESGVAPEISYQNVDWSIRGCLVTSGASSWHMGQTDCTGIPRDAVSHNLVYTFQLESSDELVSASFNHAFEANNYGGVADEIYFEIDHDNDGTFTVIERWDDFAPWSSMQPTGDYDLSIFNLDRSNQISFRFRFQSADEWTGPNTAAGWDVDDFSFTYHVIVCDPEPCPGSGDPPAEQSGLIMPDKNTISWTMDPDCTLGYKLYRGGPADLPNLLASGTSDCCVRFTGANASQNSADISSDTPASGSFFWYLVTGLNEVGEGTAGFATTAERQLDSSGDC